MSSDENEISHSSHKRKRTTRRFVDDSPDSPASTSSISSGSPIIGASSKRNRRNLPIPSETTDSESDFSTSDLLLKRKKVARVQSDSDFSSDDASSPVIPVRLQIRKNVLISESEDTDGNSDDSDIIVPRRIRSLALVRFSDYEDDMIASGSKDKPSTSALVGENATDSDSSDGQAEKCPICLLSFKLQEVGIPESCEHTFCLECIQEWSKNMNTCPVDRKSYNSITVKKSLSGEVLRKIPVEKAEYIEDPLYIIEDQTLCQVCLSDNNEDRLLLCDGCDRGYHIYCLTPPLDEVPEGHWYCNDCRPYYVSDNEDVWLESRLIPRTRQSERVRRLVQNNRSLRQNEHTDLPSTPSTSRSRINSNHVSSTSATPPKRSKKKARKSKTRRSKTTRYKTVWVLDGLGEAVPVKKKVASRKKRRSKKRRHPTSSPARILEKNVKKRLAAQLGICTPRNSAQSFPDIRLSSSNVSDIGHRRHQAGIPTLDLVGNLNQLDYFSNSDDDTINESESRGVHTLLARRSHNPSDPFNIRRIARRKAAVVNVPTVSSTSDILDSIMDSQERMLSKNSILSVVDSSGKLRIENKKESLNNKPDKPDFNSYTVRETPWYGRNNSGGYRPRSNWSNNRNWQNNRDYYQNRYGGPYNSYGQGQGNYGGNYSQGRDQFYNDTPQDYTQRTLCEAELLQDEDEEKNTSDNRTQDVDADVDIYCDIENEPVTTSRVEEEFRPPSPTAMQEQPFHGNTDDDNDSESGMVIDTDRIPEDSVSSTVGITTEQYSPGQPTYSPGQPTCSPEPPTYSTEQPTYSLVPQGYSPGRPSYSPGQTSYSPGQPSYSPGQPSYSPGPSPPQYSPGEPTGSPEERNVDPPEIQNVSLGYDELQRELASGYDALQREIASGYDELQREFASGLKEFQPLVNMSQTEIDRPQNDEAQSSVTSLCDLPKPDKPMEGDVTSVYDIPEPEAISVSDIPKPPTPPEAIEKSDVDVGTDSHVTQSDFLDIPSPTMDLEESDNRKDETEETARAENNEMVAAENKEIAAVEKKETSAAENQPLQSNLAFTITSTRLRISNNWTDDEDDDHDFAVPKERQSPASRRLKEHLSNTERPLFKVAQSPATRRLQENVLNTERPLEMPSPATRRLEESVFNKERPVKDDDEVSDDGCPNFSIYSKQSKSVALTTDISLSSTKNKQSDQEILDDGDPITDESSSLPAISQTVTVEKTGADPRLEKHQTSSWNLGGLYSDSEDENVVKKTSSFGISDIKDMTEDILSEEERSYTPVLDERLERSDISKEGLEGLDTEMISDDDRNDFDESHGLKTVTDGDALEINAKESEIEFTRPEDFEEGEIVDKNKENPEDVGATPEKKGKKEKTKNDKKNDKETKKKKKEKSKSKEGAAADGGADKENINKETFKKISKSTKERNYRGDKDNSKPANSTHERSLTPEISEKEKEAKKKKEKRKELERYNVRAIIAEKPRPPPRDQFGRDLRRSASRSRSRSYTPPLSPSKVRRNPSPIRAPTPARSRSPSRGRTPPRGRRSISKRRSKSKTKDKSGKRKERSRSRSGARKRDRSKTKKRKRSASKSNRRRKSKEKGKKKGRRSRSRRRSRSPHSRSLSPRRNRRDWTPSLSRSLTPPLHHTSPSWTPPHSDALRNQHLTVILNNDAAKKKKDKRRKRKDDPSSKRRRRDRERTPPPSKEVFASGDNILVSVSFNNENETRDVSTRDNRRRKEASIAEQQKRTKERRNRNKKDLSGVKPVAIIDLERSPFQEIASPKDVIVLSDSDNNEAESRNAQNNNCDSSQQVASPEETPNYPMGPKTPPEPSVKFALLPKPPQMRAINNPLHDPMETIEEETQDDLNNTSHKGPNTPPEEPPTSPPSSPDAYDPFEPTKSRSPTPEPGGAQREVGENANLQEILDVSLDTDKSGQGPDITKSLTPPMPDIQPADSQSSVQEIAEPKSPDERIGSSVTQTSQPTTKPVGQTIPFSSVQPTLISSTPISSTITISRINVLSSTMITPSTIPQRIVLPNQVKSSPVKIPPTKATIKSTPIKPIQSKTNNKKGSKQQNGNSLDDIILDFDSPYSPGSSDYEDLFEPPSEPPTATVKPKVNNKTKSSAKKNLSTFDSLFGSPSYNKKVTKRATVKKAGGAQSKTKHIGVKVDEDSLKILEELPNSAVEMQVKDKFLKKLNRQERVVEEVKLVLKPFYNKKKITKEEYKDIMRRAVPKICHNKSGEINPIKIRHLIEAYVRKVKHSKKVTSSSSLPQKITV